MSIRVLIADRHEIVLESLAAMIDAEPDLELAGRARDGREAIASALETEPAVTVIEIAIPVLNGIEATRRIVAERPRIRVVCLSMHRERQYVAAALEAGATGYLLKDRISENLIEAIRTVAGGGIYLCPELEHSERHQVD